MKKIVMPGIIRDNMVRRFQCHNCGCIFDSDEYEVASDYCNGLIYASVCPTCKKKAYV